MHWVLYGFLNLAIVHQSATASQQDHHQYDEDAHDQGEDPSLDHGGDLQGWNKKKDNAQVSWQQSDREEC